MFEPPITAMMDSATAVLVDLIGMMSKNVVEQKLKWPS
jgi:hypothetical protein